MREGNGINAATAELITLKQTAAILQVCAKTARNLIRNQDVPIFRVGNQIRIRRDHVALLLRKE